jgi:hypothetical protein
VECCWVKKIRRSVHVKEEKRERSGSRVGESKEEKE